MIVLGWAREGGILALLQLPRAVQTARGTIVLHCSKYQNHITKSALTKELSMKITAKMFSRGRITLPREVRRGLGVGPGDKVIFKTIGNDVYISAAKKPRSRK